MKLGVVAVLVLVQGPAARAATVNPVVEGRRLFLKMNCYGCHGIFGTGQIARNIQQPDPAGARTNITYGNSFGMPAFGKRLTSDQIGYIISYLGVAGTVTEPRFCDWWAPTPTKVCP